MPSPVPNSEIQYPKTIVTDGEFVLFTPGNPATVVIEGGGGSGTLPTADAADATIGSPIPTTVIVVGAEDPSGHAQPLKVDVSGNLLTSGGGGGGSNPAAGPTGAAVPADASYTGINVGGNLVGLSAANPMPVDGSAHTQPVSNAGLTNLDVALSTRTKPSDQQHTIIDSGTTVVTQTTGTNLHTTVDNFPATQPVSGTVAISGNVTVIQPVGTNLHVDVDQPLPAGTNVIGHVIADTGSTTVVTGNVTVIQPTGTSLHAVLDSTSTTTVTQATGTNLHTVLDSGTLTSITNALPSGTNVIGHVINDTGSTTVVTGTVSVQGAKTNNNAAPGATNLGVLPAIANAATQAWTEGDQVLESVDLNGSLRTGSGSQPVVTTTWTSATALNTALTVNVTNYPTAVFTFLGTGTITGSVVFEGSTDGGITFPVPLPTVEYSPTSAFSLVIAAVNQPTSNVNSTTFSAGVSGLTHARVRLSVVMSTGTAVWTASASSVASNPVIVAGSSTLPVSISNPSVLTVQSGGTGVSALVSQGTASNLRTAISGNAGAAMDAAGQNAASPGNSLLVAGQFNTSPTTITNNHMSPLQLDNAGNLLVNIKAGTSGNGAASNTGSAVPTQADYVGYNSGGNLVGVSATNALPVTGNKTNNNAAPDATNFGVLSAVANAANPSWTEGDLVLKSVDLIGSTRVAQGATGVVTATWNSSTTTNTAITIATSNYPTAVLTIVTTGTVATGVLILEGSIDGGSTYPLSVSAIFSNTQATGYGFLAAGTSIALPTANSPSTYFMNAAGLTNFRVRLNPTITNTGSIALGLSSSSISSLPSAVVGASTNGPVTVSQATASNLNATVSIASAQTLGTVTTVSTVSAARIVGNTGSVIDASLGAATAPTVGLGQLVRYVSSAPALTGNQTVSQQADSAGTQFVRPYRRSQYKATPVTITASTTPVTAVAAQGAAVFADITGFFVTVTTAATTATAFTITLSDGTASYVFDLDTGALATASADPTILTLAFPTPLPATTANTAWTATSSSATPTLHIVTTFIINLAN